MLKKSVMIIAILLCVCSSAQAADTWSSGQSHFYSRRGLTGGGTALDALSGLSMCPNDYAVTLDISGNSIYFHQVSATGNDSGTTTESAPFWIAPNSSDSGNTLAGVSMWKLCGVSGDTGYFKTLVIDTRTVKGTDVDAWNIIQSQVSSFVAGQLRTYLAASAFSGDTDFALDGQVTFFVLS